MESGYRSYDPDDFMAAFSAMYLRHTLAEREDGTVSVRVIDLAVN